MRALVAVCALLLVAACGGSDDPGADPATTGRPSTTPTTDAPRASASEVAVETLMRALDDGDCAAVKQVVVTPATVDCDVVAQAEDSFADEGIDLDEVVYRAGQVQGSSSTVTITWGNEYPDEAYDVEKIDGRWRVVFDSVA